MNEQADAQFNWGTGLRTSWRLLPERRTEHTEIFLNSDGQTKDEVWGALPLDRARAEARARRTGNPVGSRPDQKRYRDPRQVYQALGLLYEDDSQTIRLTDLGIATRRWLGILNQNNGVLLARHAAYALSACQLRNPTSSSGRAFGAEVAVFPFADIWRAMLALDNKIDSDELNRAILHVRNEDDLHGAIDRIRRYREGGCRDPESLGPESVTEEDAKNDRIIPWMAGASFGWLMIGDKRAGESAGYYQIPEGMVPILAEAAAVRHRTRDFGTTPEYARYISEAAALPKDLR